MHTYKIRVLPGETCLTVPAGTNLMEALRDGGLHLDAPCGGRGACGKCRVLLDGAEALACQTAVDRDMTVELPRRQAAVILTQGLQVETRADGAGDLVLAFDIGTTTVVAYLMNGRTGALLAQASCLNPQTEFGADVISRIQYVMDTGSRELQTAILGAMADLTRQAAGAAGFPGGGGGQHGHAPPVFEHRSQTPDHAALYAQGL